MARQIRFVQATAVNPSQKVEDVAIFNEHGSPVSPPAAGAAAASTLSADDIGMATTIKAGLVKQAAAVSDAAGTNVTKAEYNALLANLRAAGVLAV